MTVDEYKNRYQKYIDFISKYKTASNASTGSEVDSNANVESKNITTLSGEIYKREAIGTNRLLMMNKLSELYGEAWAERYIDRLESHLLYKHDETNLGPYTYSSKEVVVARVNGNVKLISLEDLYDLCDAEAKLVDAEKGVWCKYPADNTIQVLDRDGYTEVSRLVRKQRHRDLVRVKTAFGEDLIVTDNHPLIISDDVNDTIDAIDAVGHQQFRTELRIPFQGRTIESLNVLSPWNVQQYDNFYMSQIIPRGCYTAVNNNVQMDRDMGYFIGFFIGDGNYVAHAGEITGTVSFTQKDKQVLEKLAEIVHQHLGIGSVISHKKDKLNCWNLTIQSADLVLLLSQICGIKHYAPHKTLPVNIYDYTEDFALGVIDGLIDSDGTISRDGTCSIRLASRTAIMQLTMLAHSLGFAGGNIVQNTPFSNNTLYTTNYTIFGYQWKLTTEDMRRLHADKIAKIENATSGGTKYKAGWSNIVNVTTVDNGSFLQDNDFIYDITTGSHSFICNGLWVHNCVSITLYPFLFNGLVPLGGQSEAPKNLDSFCGSFVNLVFAVAAQFAGAVSTPEFLTYLDYFLRREFGEDYYKHSNDIVIHSIKPKTICDRIDAAFQQVVYSLNQPAAARNFQSVLQCALIQ